MDVVKSTAGLLGSKKKREGIKSVSGRLYCLWYLSYLETSMIVRSNLFNKESEGLREGFMSALQICIYLMEFGMICL